MDNMLHVIITELELQYYGVTSCYFLPVSHTIPHFLTETLCRHAR